MRKFVPAVTFLASVTLFSLHADEVVLKKKLKEAVAEEIEEAEDEIAVLAEDEQQELELEQVAENQ